MSISNDPEERNLTSSKQSKIIYTRGYLLSLSELDICIRLPEGIDESLLSEFRSSPEQGFRRNEYGSSPPGKGETGNFSRGFQRWDSRTSWRTDSDSQSDRDSDSGRRYGNQFRRSSQNPEHDGLLGSGSIPRPPGYGPGSSVPPSGANDQRQLNRSYDPYHPPRPYKAVPHSWRETKDSLNDETFGSTEDTGEDRVEEERKRRAEFEMMRKEQQKELQEKLKSKKMNKLKDDPLTELAASVDAGDNAVMTIGLDESLVKPIQQNDFSKVSISSQGHPFRSLMPPGFANAATKITSGPKFFGNPLEVGKPETGEYTQEKKPAVQPRLDEKHPETAFLWASKGGKKVDLSSAFDLSSKLEDPDDQSLGASKFLGISEIPGNDKVTGIGPENDSGRKIVGEAGHGTYILGKIFEGALNIESTGPSNIVEDDNMKADIYFSPNDIHSSKFAQWFLEEERKAVESGSSDKPNALFSLIVGEKSGSVASDTLTTDQMLPPESNLVKMGTLAPSNGGVSGPLYNKNKSESNSAVLTCEDLEQSIISDFGGSSLSSQPPGILCSQHGLKNEIPVADINSNASQHLLSLLQKGISSNSKTTSPISILDKGLPGESLDLDSERTIQGNLRDLNAENLSSGKGLTLETLFGTAFMNELQSFDAPISVQRNSAESLSISFSESSMQPVADSADGAINTSVSEARFKRVNKDDIILRLGRAQQTNLEKVGMNWLTADSSHKEVESSNLLRFDLHLPEEDRLNSLGFPVNVQSSMFMANAEMLSSSSNSIVDVPEKLAALGTSVKDERPIAGRQDSSPFSRGPFDMLKPEMPYPSMHAQSSPQFNPTMVNHGRPVFPPLDPHVAHINPHFMPLEGINHQDAAIHHQISANLGRPPFQHPNSGLSQFDHSMHPMLQQMHMPNILPPAPFLPGFPGGAPHLPLHSGGNPPGYVQDHNLAHGFLFGQQQPNPVDFRVPLQGGEHGSLDNNPPQAFQRLLEMELRSNPKPRHPSFPGVGGHSRPMFGHELDTGFWYR